MSIREIPNETFKLNDTSSFWDDFEFGANPTKYYTFFDDFDYYTSAVDNAVGYWINTGTGTGTQALVDEANGTVLLTTGATDDNSEEMQLDGETFLPAANRILWYETRFNISHASDLDWWLGMAVTDTTLIDGVTDGIYFKGTDGTAAIDFAGMASSVSSGETGLKTTVADTYYTVGFKVTGTGLIEYWVDGVKKGSIDANIPTTEMALGMAVQAGSAAARALEVDYVFCAQTRVP